MELTRHALLGLTIGVIVGACQACAGSGREEIPTPGCQLSVYFEPQALDTGLAALARINAATGCEIEAADEGVPLSLVETLELASGEPACGQTSIARYSDGALHDVVEMEVATQVGGCNSLEAIIIHEVFHAMIATSDVHSEGGVFDAFSGQGELINEATLATVCAHMECPSFRPED